jgi:methylated-DNA-protein-cysteine methyltransferase related protein
VSACSRWFARSRGARVATYGQVALLAGAPRAARQVGGILHRSSDHDDVPWHRVVNASGGISTHKVGAGTLQEALLRSEGVDVGATGVDLGEYLWQPPVGFAP